MGVGRFRRDQTGSSLGWQDFFWLNATVLPVRTETRNALRSLESRVHAYFPAIYFDRIGRRRE